MTVKEFLNQGYHAKARIRAKEERIESWRQIAESITAQIRQDSIGSSLPSKKVEDCACNIVDLQNEIKEEIAALVQAEREVGKFINEAPLDETDRFILELRYLNYKKWEEIAVELNYAYRWLMRRHKRAISVLEEHWPC